MKINTENYEAYLLDLWENNLSREEKVMLFNFLADHPELDEADALDLLKDISLTKSADEFDKAAIDFTTINEKNYTFFFIAYAEDDLLEKEKIEVDAFVAHHPELAKEFDQFRRAKLPVEKIEFPNKKALHGVVTPTIYFQPKWILGIAAASVALLLWFAFPLKNVEQKYALDSFSTIELEQINSVKYERPISTSTSPKKETLASNRSSLAASKVSVDLPKAPDYSASKDTVLGKGEPKQHINSLAQIKAHHLSDVTAALNRIEEPSDVAIVDNKQIQEKIPTILELTTAYLERQKTAIEERLPTAQEFVNNTFAKNNGGKPVIQTSESNTMKRTVFRLGQFEFERIAKK